METYVLGGDNRHLAACRPCKARFDELVRIACSMMHEAASQEADSAFTADRLHDQRDRIMRRIERHDHPAEVVAFPHQRVPSHVPTVHRMLGPARRWVAGAAAAGLAAGMFLGFAMDRRSTSARRRSRDAAVRNRRARACRLPPTISSSSRSTRRWSTRARARCAPISARST